VIKRERITASFNFSPNSYGNFGDAVPRRNGLRSNRPWSSEWQPRYRRCTLFGVGERQSRHPGIFNDGLARFQEVESVSNGANNGLGPRFNSNSCSSCHTQPAVGGTGPATNPQFQFTSNGVAPRDTTPYFILANGPTREARFPFFFNPDGTANTNAPNGGVENLFTVTGRSDAGACSLSQPSFNAAKSATILSSAYPRPLLVQV